MTLSQGACNSPLKGARVEDVALERVNPLDQGHVRARVDARGHDDLVKVLRPSALDVDDPSVIGVVAPHARHRRVQAQPPREVKVLDVGLEIALHVPGSTMAGRLVGEGEVGEAALGAM